jgi:predicted Zn-dependent peptidase
LLGQYETIALEEHVPADSRGYHYLETLLERVADVTIEEVATAAQKYLTEDNRTVGYLIDDPEPGEEERDSAA